MSCSKEYLISLYIDGQLSEKQEQKVREHLLKCRHCKKVYEEFNNLQELLDNVDKNVEIVEPTYEESLMATRKILKAVRELKEKGDTDFDDMPPLTQFTKPVKNNKRKFFYTVSSLAASVVLAVTLSVLYFNQPDTAGPTKVVGVPEIPEESSTVDLPSVVDSPPNNEVVVLPKKELPQTDIQPELSDFDLAKENVADDLPEESELNGLPPDYIETKIAKVKEPDEPINVVSDPIEPEQPQKPPEIKKIAEVFQVDEDKIKEPVELQVVVSERFYPAQLADAGSGVNVSYQKVINEYGETEYKVDPTGTAQAVHLKAEEHINEFRKEIIELVNSDKVEGMIIDTQSKDVLVVDIPKRNYKWFISILEDHGKAQMMLGPFVESIDDMDNLDANNNDLVRMRITLDISKDVQN